MKRNDYVVRFQDQLYAQKGAGIWLIKYDRAKQQMFVAKPVELIWEPHPEWFLLPAPTLAVEPEAIPAFAKGLIEAEKLPQSLIDNDQQLQAMRAHLDDMRKIAFHEIGIGAQS